MTDYGFYKETFKGKLEKAIFDDILPRAIDIMTLFANELCNMNISLDEYGIFDKAICYQIECMHQLGVQSIHGAVGEGSITQIKTGNYTIDYKSNQNHFMYKGIPFASMTRWMMIDELKSNGKFKLVM